MAVVRKVKLTSDIIKGESIIYDYPAGTNIDLIDPAGVKTSYSYPFQAIDTNAWEVGVWTAIIASPKAYGVNQFELIDPTSKASAYNNLKKIIEEIDTIIIQRATNGGVISQSIQNKSLTYESSEALMKLRRMYVERANDLLSSMKGYGSAGSPIKSITNFRGKR
ncbi:MULTISPECIES: hypothetical protein [Klebsiella/Raoultella group]|uniref:Uncharacterized protein n=2 Tax=Enterobacteriaceae TaxID=543 RepID=A0ABD7AJS6_9ENTR|nr:MULTISPECIES: hypothetical protein [Klebsiella/Raoultella group]QLO53208.1 hypothetical protein HV234_17535 [Klebsiella grimontii]TJZ59575.1 hypothetical protein FA013_30465 [Raoultella planticola]TYD91074.1 hypothetical protein DJ519_01515 [Klebsiella michiganensis]